MAWNRAIKDFEGRVYLRGKRCREARCVHESGAKDDEYLKQRHTRLCRECWGEGGDDESESIHSSDLKAAGLD